MVAVLFELVRWLEVEVVGSKTQERVLNDRHAHNESVTDLTKSNIFSRRAELFVPTLGAQVALETPNNTHVDSINMYGVYKCRFRLQGTYSRVYLPKIAEGQWFW